MATRSVLVRLSAQVGEYISNMGKAEKATEKLGQTQDQTSQKSQQSQERTNESGKRTAAQLAEQAAAAQSAAKALGLKYDADGRLVDSQGRVLSSSQAAAHGLENFSDAVYLTAHASQEAETRLEGMARKAKDLEGAGTALVAFGTVTVAALGAVAKAAMDWESAWAGVTKTVDGTPAQMAELEQGLRNLAKELPATHQEIAAVAEAAGQLGVKQEDVLGFTKTMIDLGETTNLTSDEAATSIAQISNVMGTMAREGSRGVERFASTLVLLGNNGASTEKEILAMAQRMAGAMKLVGASESDLLAMANAMASVGIEAQLGGGVMSRTMTSIYAATQEGGEALDAWAGAARMSASDFSEAFAKDPVRALDSVVQGLQKTKEEGGNVVGVLDELGIKGTQDVSVMLMLAGAGDLLSTSLDQGAAAWAANTALVEEAEKRYATTEAQVQMAWNSIKDAAIDAGAVLLPIIATMAEGVASLADMFGSLPAPVQGVVTVLGGVAGVAALAVGGFILLFPRVMDTVESMKKLRDISPGAADGLGKLAKGAAVAGAIAAVGIALAKVVESGYMKDIDTGMGQVAEAFAKVEAGGPGAASALDELFKDRNGGDLINNVDSLDTALDRMFKKSPGEKFNDWGQSVVSATTQIEGSAAILEDSFGRMDQGLADLVSSGSADEAASVFENITKWAEANGVEIDEVAAKFPQYADALAAANAEQIKAADGAEGVTNGLTGAAEAAALAEGPTSEAADALAEVGLAADGTVISLGKYLESLFAAGLAVMDSSEASYTWANTLRDSGKAVDDLKAKQGELGLIIDEATGRFNINTDAGLEANSMLLGMAREGLNVAEVFANDVTKSQEDVQGQLRSTYDSLVSTAQGLGMSEDAANALIREILQIPDNVDIDTWMDEEAQRRVEALQGKLNEVDGRTINTYAKHHETTIKEIVMTERNERVGVGQVGRHAGGGRLPRHSTGGRLPTTGPGTDRTDGIMGVSSEGAPIAWVDAGEWIINGHSSEKYDRLLRAINDDTVPDNLFTAGAGVVPTYTPPTVHAPTGGGSGRAPVQVTFHSYNAVAEPESRIIEKSSTHLAMAGGI